MEAATSFENEAIKSISIDRDEILSSALNI